MLEEPARCLSASYSMKVPSVVAFLGKNKSGVLSTLVSPTLWTPLTTLHPSNKTSLEETYRNLKLIFLVLELPSMIQDSEHE